MLYCPIYNFFRACGISFCEYIYVYGGFDDAKDRSNISLLQVQIKIKKIKIKRKDKP